MVQKKKKPPDSAKLVNTLGYLGLGWDPPGGQKNIFFWGILVVVHPNPYLELQTTSSLWLFQLDDSKSLHGKWLLNQTSIKNWLFRVPGIYIYTVYIYIIL